jgi:hypothetical protein
MITTLNHDGHEDIEGREDFFNAESAGITGRPLELSLVPRDPGDLCVSTIGLCSSS